MNNSLVSRIGFASIFPSKICSVPLVFVLSMGLVACGGSSGGSSEEVIADLPPVTGGPEIVDEQGADSDGGDADESSITAGDVLPDPADTSQPPQSESPEPGPSEQTPEVVTIPETPLNLVAAAAAPEIDGSSQVTWPFAPVASSIQLEIMPFVEMPLSNEGGPARWNDMEYVADRLFVSDERDGFIFEISDRDPVLWFDVATAMLNVTGLALNTENPFHGGLRGFAFHPDFESNGKFYVSLMQNRPASTAGLRYLSDAAVLNADSVLIEWTCLLYTSPSPRDATLSRMPSSA